VRKDAGEKHYVIDLARDDRRLSRAGRRDHPADALGGRCWKYAHVTAGVGLVMILRWYWWRINAWSEISALAISAVAGKRALRV